MRLLKVERSGGADPSNLSGDPSGNRAARPGDCLAHRFTPSLLLFRLFFFLDELNLPPTHRSGVDTHAPMPPLSLFLSHSEINKYRHHDIIIVRERGEGSYRLLVVALLLFFFVFCFLFCSFLLWNQSLRRKLLLQSNKRNKGSDGSYGVVWQPRPNRPKGISWHELIAAGHSGGGVGWGGGGWRRWGPQKHNHFTTWRNMVIP